MKNARINTDLRLEISFKAGGATIDMTSIDVLSLYMYCNPQKARDGAIKHSVSTSDAKVLEMIWPADVQRYLGEHSVHGTIRYSGAIASFDIPAVNVVSKTSEADISTDTIVLEAPVGTEDLIATITIQGMGPQGPKGDKMTYEDLSEADKEDIYAGGAQILKPLLATKANLQHQHKVADITNFPELYYDATAFFASAYPSDKYGELLDAVKAKKTVYATLDEEGNISYVFFTSLANSDASSSRVLLTTVFVDGSYLYLNTFVLRPSGMTRLQENITSKADKATTLAGYGIGDAYTKSEVDVALSTKQDTLTAGNGISIKGGVISSTVDTLITPITYAELVALRNSSSLVAGMQYRITDYACTTTQENTQSAGHPFDIIVTADSENTLNEEARAIQHEGDTYFADCDLNAWKIWYCLDNDATRFAWADSVNGKGVIYRMIDEWSNDVPYDFKNIMYNGSWGYWAYTFNWINDESDNTCEDLSVAQYVHTNDEGGYSHTYGNIIKPYGGDGGGNYGYPLQLNECVFLNKESYDGGFFYGCNSNSFGYNCYSNSFGDYCYSNSFGYNCYSNSFGYYCYSNSFGNDCYHNSFGNDCYSNSFGNNCYYIKFASTSSATTKYNYYRQNHFGDGCLYILLKGAETASSSAQVQNYNFAQGLQGTSSAYLTIDGVRNRAYETKVAKNSSGELKIYCEADLIQ